MALNLDAVGRTSGELTHTYAWQDVALYALGVGASRDDLDFVYEARGPQVLPTYIVVPTFTAHAALFSEIGGQLAGLVHAGQKIVLHRPLPPSGTLKTVATIDGIYDLKRMARSEVHTETRDEAGALLAETWWSLLYRLDGGFDGPSPPKTPVVRPPDRDPDFVVKEKTSPDQAVLYRLGSGDTNPLHIDPEFAKQAGFDRPILHGLCTYGYVGRAVLRELCDDEPGRLKSLAGQFRKPVWPGETLVTEGWKEEGRVVLRAQTEERPGEHVFSHAYAEIE